MSGTRKSCIAKYIVSHKLLAVGETQEEAIL